MYKVIHTDTEKMIVETLGLFRYYTDASNSAFAHAREAAKFAVVKFEYPNNDCIRPIYATGTHQYMVVKG
tara:strand:+ start:3718 stop:3927 length:210 start_codon:yes stop_codon:yes gene_type:complete